MQNAKEVLTVLAPHGFERDPAKEADESQVCVRREFEWAIITLPLDKKSPYVVYSAGWFNDGCHYIVATVLGLDVNPN